MYFNFKHLIILIIVCFLFCNAEYDRPRRYHRRGDEVYTRAARRDPHLKDTSKSAMEHIKDYSLKGFNIIHNAVSGVRKKIQDMFSHQYETINEKKELAKHNMDRMKHRGEDAGSNLYMDMEHKRREAEDVAGDAYKRVRRKGERFSRNARNKAEEYGKRTQDSMEDAYDYIEKGGRRMYDDVKKKGEYAYDKMKDIGKEAYEEAKNKGSYVYDEAADTSGDMYENFKEKGEDFYDTMKEGGEYVYENLKEGSEKIYDRAKESAENLNAYEQVKEGGEYIMDRMGDVYGSAKQGSEDISHKMEDAYKRVKQGGRRLINRFKKGGEKIMENILDEHPRRSYPGYGNGYNLRNRESYSYSKQNQGAGELGTHPTDRIRDCGNIDYEGILERLSSRYFGVDDLGEMVGYPRDRGHDWDVDYEDDEESVFNKVKEMGMAGFKKMRQSIEQTVQGMESEYDERDIREESLDLIATLQKVEISLNRALRVTEDFMASVEERLKEY